MPKFKEKELDQITLDSIAAEKAGLSYGRYIALYKTNHQIPQAHGKRIVNCLHCGAKIIRYDKRDSKFCSVSCREKHYYSQKHSADAKLANPDNIPVKICPICQTEFITSDKRKKYCGRTCTITANKIRIAENKAKKAKNAGEEQ